MESEIFAVPQSIMEGPGEQLFDHIAQCMARYYSFTGKQLFDHIAQCMARYNSFTGKQPFDHIAQCMTRYHSTTGKQLFGHIAQDSVWSGRLQLQDSSC